MRSDVSHEGIVYHHLGERGAFRYSARMHTIFPVERNSILRQKAKEIPTSEMTSKRIRTLIRDMRALLAKEEHGVALAAPQVGEPLRLFIVSGRALLRQAQDKSPRHPKSEYEAGNREADLSRAESRDQIYINPELIKMSRGRKDKHEGCLSIRGKWGTVPRAEKMTIRAYDEKGMRFTRGASGFLAHIFQHEMDHLEGILYIDKATHVYDEKESKQ